MCGDCIAVIVCFNDTATTEIYTLSLHDALPISVSPSSSSTRRSTPCVAGCCGPMLISMCSPARSGSSAGTGSICTARSEEHTSELQSRQYLVCRLLLEKKIHAHPLPSAVRLHDA